VRGVEGRDLLNGFPIRLSTKMAIDSLRSFLACLMYTLGHDYMLSSTLGQEKAKAFEKKFMLLPVLFLFYPSKLLDTNLLCLCFYHSYHLFELQVIISIVKIM